VIIHEEEGDAFLLHVESGRYYGLNRSALVVWNAVVAGADPVDALTQKWPQRQPETLRSDAEALVTGLLNAGLITEQTEAPGPAA
jgi:hypothetical protein